MCGITGFWQLNDFAAEGARATATQMAAAIAYRGPDDYGVWLDEGANFALAHRRLSIVDLSPAGHQPMLSANGRYVMAFNGEIYNHIEMRRELESLTPSLTLPLSGGEFRNFIYGIDVGCIVEVEDFAVRRATVVDKPCIISTRSPSTAWVSFRFIT